MKSVVCVVLAVLASFAMAFEVPHVEGVDILSSSNLSLATEGDWLLILYAPWCPHCHSLLEKLPDLSKGLSEHKVKIGVVDADADPSLQIQFSVHGFPSIFMVHEGAVYPFSEKVSPSVENLLKWSTKEYADKEPVTGYKAPFGILMRAFAVYSSFAISIYRFLEVYANQFNIPPMYLFCGLAVFVAVLVIILMCVTSRCFKAPKKSISQVKKNVPPPAEAAVPVEKKEEDAEDDEEKKAKKEQQVRRRAVKEDKAGIREQQKMMQKNKIKKPKSGRQQNMPTQQPSKR